MIALKRDEKHLSLRIEEELLRRFDYVAKYDDRSMNWLLNALIRKCIAEFEEEHGKIVLPEDAEDAHIL